MAIFTVNRLGLAASLRDVPHDRRTSSIRRTRWTSGSAHVASPTGQPENGEMALKPWSAVAFAMETEKNYRRIHRLRASLDADRHTWIQRRRSTLQRLQKVG